MDGNAAIRGGVPLPCGWRILVVAPLGCPTGVPGAPIETWPVGHGVWGRTVLVYGKPDYGHYNTFMFDLDGTLLDTLPDLVRTTNAALAELGFSRRTSAEILSFVGDGLRKLLERAAPAGTSDERVEELRQAWRRHAAKSDNGLTVPFEGMVEALGSLVSGGARIAVLSNKVHEAAVQVIAQRMPVAFDAVYGEMDGIPRKPDPSGILYVMGELGAQPGKTVYVGDSPGDMEAAKAAGVLAAGVSWGYRPVETLVAAGADVILDSPGELLALMRG